jgi:hypothetical protein
MFPAGEGGGSSFSSDQMSTLFDYSKNELTPTGAFLLIAGAAALMMGGVLVAHR